MALPKSKFLMREKLTLGIKRAADEKRFPDKVAEFWTDKAAYKIKDDYEIREEPEDVVKSDIDFQASLFRGNIDGIVFPESPTSSKPSGVQNKGKLSKTRGWQALVKWAKLEDQGRPVAAKGHVGKQKPVVAVDPKGGSSCRKKVVASHLQADDELDKIAKRIGPNDEPSVPAWEPFAPACACGKQDSEGQVEN